MKRIKIFDTTLRDGEQSPGCSMNLNEKIEVAKCLEKLQVDVIEAGFAISSRGDFESVKTIAETVKECTVASLARANAGDIDAAYEAVRNAADPRIHLFIATSPLHMEYKLKMSPETVLERTAEMVKYASKYCSNIEFSAEDATRSDPEFLAKVVKAAIDNGATVINIPDTVGYSTPEEIKELFGYLISHVENADKVEFSAHCHNDLGMAVANSLAAVSAGALQIECTINGLGERAGNTALEEVVMAMRTRSDRFPLQPRLDTTKIFRASRTVYNIIGQSAPINKPIVGKNAFAHESGIHQHGVLANRLTYEIRWESARIAWCLESIPENMPFPLISASLAMSLLRMNLLKPLSVLKRCVTRKRRLTILILRRLFMIKPPRIYPAITRLIDMMFTPETALPQPVRSA